METCYGIIGYGALTACKPGILLATKGQRACTHRRR